MTPLVLYNTAILFSIQNYLKLSLHNTVMSEENGRVTTSIKVHPDFWADVKIHCIKNKLEVSEFVEKTLKRAIGGK